MWEINRVARGEHPSPAVSCCFFLSLAVSNSTVDWGPGRHQHGDQGFEIKVFFFVSGETRVVFNSVPLLSVALIGILV